MSRQLSVINIQPDPELNIPNDNTSDEVQKVINPNINTAEETQEVMPELTMISHDEKQVAKFKNQELNKTKLLKIMF